MRTPGRSRIGRADVLQGHVADDVQQTIELVGVIVIGAGSDAVLMDGEPFGGVLADSHAGGVVADAGLLLADKGLPGLDGLALCGAVEIVILVLDAVPAIGTLLQVLAGHISLPPFIVSVRNDDGEDDAGGDAEGLMTQGAAEVIAGGTDDEQQGGHGRFFFIDHVSGLL